VHCIVAVHPSLVEVSADRVANERLFMRHMRGANDTTTNDLSKMPQAPAQGDIKVFYLQAPLLKAQYGNLLGSIDLFHGGVGFEMPGGKQFAVEYDAIAGLFGALFPVTENGTLKTDGNKVVWNNQAEVPYMDLVDMTYWTNKTEVATINPAVYSKVREYVLGYLDKHPRYRLWTVIEGQDVHAKPVQLASQTCVDFVWDVLGAINDNGGCLSPKGKPKRDYSLLYNHAATPTYLDMSNAADLKKFETWAQSIAANVAQEKQKLHSEATYKGKPVNTMKDAVDAVHQAMGTILARLKSSYVYVDDSKVLEVAFGDGKNVRMRYTNEPIVTDPFAKKCASNVTPQRKLRHNRAHMRKHHQ